MLTTLTALLVSCSLSFCMTLPPSNRLKLKHQVFAQIAGTLAASGGIEDATATGKPRSLRHAPPSLFAYDVDCRGSCYPLAGEAELKLLDDIGTTSERLRLAFSCLALVSRLFTVRWECA